jgi:hypothetical protein
LPDSLAEEQAGRASRLRLLAPGHEQRKYRQEEQPEVLGGTSPPLRDIRNVLRREYPRESGQKTVRIVACPALRPALKDSPMYVLRAFAFLLFFARVALAEQPTPILPDPKLSGGRRLRAVPG